MIAGDDQVQHFVDSRIRQRAEQMRSLVISLTYDISAIDDVYAALTKDSPTWTDVRTDSPPHLMTGSDVLVMNALMRRVLAAITGDPQYAIAMAACVRPIQ